MTARKKTEPPKMSTGPDDLFEKVQAWALDDLQAIFESLESAEQILQGMSDVGTIDITLSYEGRKLAAHHDGTRWWVTLVG